MPQLDPTQEYILYNPRTGQYVQNYNGLSFKPLEHCWLIEEACTFTAEVAEALIRSSRKRGDTLLVIMFLSEDRIKERLITIGCKLDRWPIHTHLDDIIEYVRENISAFLSPQDYVADTDIDDLIDKWFDGYYDYLDTRR